MLKVAILVFDDVEELDAIGPYEVFGMAGQQIEGSFEVFTVGETPDRPVQCVHGLRIVPHYGLENSPSADVLVIPGGVGTRKAASNPAIQGWVVRTAANASWVASVCTGARITLATGLATGRKVTTHWSAIDEIRAHPGGAKEVLSDVRFVVDGNLVHAAGVSAGVDMALWLVGTLLEDGAAARRVQRQMEYYPSPPFTFEVNV